MNVRSMMETLAVAVLAGSSLSPVAARAQESEYWQQEIHYTIEASLDEAAEVLHGVAQVRYVNRSPETLDVLYFHQYLNAFRPGSAWANNVFPIGSQR